MRKTTAFCFTLLTAAALIGCSSTSVHGKHGEHLTVYEPADQTIERGATNQVMLTLGSAQLNGPLEVDFDNLPDGVRVIEDKMEIPVGKTFATFTLYAEDDADLVADRTVTVMLESDDGLAATQYFDLDVVPRSN